VDFIASKPLGVLYVSTVTFAEIRFGIELVTDPARRKTLVEWLDQKLRPMFDQRVLTLTEDAMLRWRILVEEGRKVGHTFSMPDLLIAATALEHGLTVVTRDTEEYERAGALVANPWEK
jgi:predicted nucleic acid-binding protein